MRLAIHKSMIYKTKRAALLSLIEFSPAMRAIHVIIPATIDGVRVGYTRRLVRNDASLPIVGNTPQNEGESSPHFRAENPASKLTT